MEIRTKADFFRLWTDGVLGFKLRTWEDPRDAVAAGVPLCGFRQLGVAGGGAFEMAERSDIMNVAEKWTAAGRKFMVCEAAPDQLATIQGEVCRGIRGWEGLLGRVINGKRMRDSIKDGDLTPRHGVVVLAMLDQFMAPSSRDDLDALLDLYPDATVEFTCYGDHNFDRGRNTIFWEVRNY